ncbi:hypothetical protein BGZ57DRAFT_483430 [Hyaloscypha finlandica]|nr:hypothetical protein BGZ57DRAFT_483430 [Hyaloscypha finlandica]
MSCWMTSFLIRYGAECVWGGAGTGCFWPLPFSTLPPKANYTGSETESSHIQVARLWAWVLLVRGQPPPEQPSIEGPAVYVLVGMSPYLPDPYPRSDEPALSQPGQPEQHILHLLRLRGYAARSARFSRAISWTSSSEMSIHSESSSNRTYFGGLLAVGAETKGWVYSNFPSLGRIDSDAWLTSSCDTLNALSVAVFSLLDTLVLVTEVLFLPLTIYRIYASCHRPITASNILRLRGRAKVQGVPEVPCGQGLAAAFRGAGCSGRRLGCVLMFLKPFQFSFDGLLKCLVWIKRTLFGCGDKYERVW